MKRISVLALLMLLLTGGAASAATVFTTDFESGAPAQIGGFGGLFGAGTLPGVGATIWRNDSGGNPASPTTLTLTGLAANSAVSLSFSFIAIDSWDGTTFSCCTPDYLRVDLNGQNVMQAAVYQCCGGGSTLDSLTFSNGAGGSMTQAFFNGGNHLATGSWPDSVWSVTITGLTTNGSGNATFSFYAAGAGWQAGADESVGLDNLLVTGTIPLPASLVLLASGLSLIGVARGWCARQESNLRPSA